jgi:hypothetical protein
MGYTVTTEGVSFAVPPANIEAALVALKGAAMLRGEIEPLTALIAAIEEHGFTACDTPDGGMELNFYCDRSSSQDELVLALVPYAEDGSYIEWRGEQDERWRDLVHNGQLYTQRPQVSWVPDPSDPGLAAATPPELSTVIPTLYRDGTNCKVHGQIRLTGPITPTQVAALRDALDEGLYYAPADIGHIHLGQREWTAGFPSDGVDHCWHEMCLDEIEIVATDDLAEAGDHIANAGTPEQFVALVAAAAEHGWQDSTTCTDNH